MSRRLKIAKKLLSDRGVIFISIDDNEQAQLKLLCDEIFGADRFITNLIWQKKNRCSRCQWNSNNYRIYPCILSRSSKC